MLGSRPGRCAVGSVVAGLLVAGVAGCGSGSAAPTGARQRALDDARRFLSAYVDGSGRVIRRDQGGDTVSEGQGYAMLLADATDDRAVFTRVWRWTQTNLEQPDHLFAYRWAGGHVADPSPAADADTQIAWALAVGAQRFHDPKLSAAARTIAVAVAANEVGYDDSGKPTVAAGPWAVPQGQPATTEPGYWTYPADDDLAALTGDGRWRQLTDADLAHVRTLTSDGQRLPADWADVGGGRQPTAVPAPGPSSPSAAPVSGQDGLRALVWTSCTPAGRSLTSRWWQLISSTATQAPLTRSLNGSPAAPDRAPLGAVAAAAAAPDAPTRDHLLAVADNIARRYPTYYGSAWAALGRVLLTTTLLTRCGVSSD